MVSKSLKELIFKYHMYSNTSHTNDPSPQIVVIMGYSFVPLELYPKFVSCNIIG